MKRTTLVLLSSLCLVACPKQERSANGPDARPADAGSVVLAKPEPSDVPADEPSSVADASTSAGHAALPEPFKSLGQPCPGAGAKPEPLCDKAGRVAGVWALVDTVDGVPPPQAEVIRDEPLSPGQPGRSLVVAVEGERLWFRQVTCGMCRRIMGWSFVGDLPKLGEDQIRAIQTRLALPTNAPTLRTANDWRDFYKSHPLPK